MLKSIALIMLIGMSAGWICRKVKLPGLLGMLFTGIILGALIFRMDGVALCMAGTKLKLKEFRLKGIYSISGDYNNCISCYDN